MTPFYEEKGWWKSRTVWVGIIAAAYAALSIVGVEAPFGVDQTTAAEIATGLTGLLAIYFRVVATKAITPEVVPTLSISA